MPQLPPGSPFEEFFDDFFKNRRGPGGGSKGGGDMQPRKTNSLGSGFIVDTSASSSPIITSSRTPTRST